MPHPLQPLFDDVFRAIQDMGSAIAMTSITPSGTRTSEVRARRIARQSGRPPMVRVGARETGLMKKVSAAVVRADDWLDKLGLQGSIDEVALMLPQGTRERDDWLSCMMARVGREGVTYFNHSDSTVHVRNLPSKYEVKYHFFTTSVPGVRIELMDLKGGHSPLHELFNHATDARGRDACVVHSSFKVTTEEDYRVVCALLAGMGWTCGQDCSSDYGLFSYWRQPDDDDSLLWLKPRVNLRDGITSAPLPADEAEEPEGSDEEPEDFEDFEEEDDDDV